MLGKIFFWDFPVSVFLITTNMHIYVWVIWLTNILIKIDYLINNISSTYYNKSKGQMNGYNENITYLNLCIEPYKRIHSSFQSNF